MNCKEFTRQVLGQLSDFEANSGALQLHKSDTNVILIISCIPAQQAAVAFMECAALLRFGFRIKVLSQEASKLQDYLLPGMTASDTPVQDWSHISKILILPDRRQTANIALGIPGGDAENAVLHALWHNLPVYADYSTMLLWDGKPCANTALHALYQSYRNTLASFGVQEISPGAYLHALLDEQPHTDGHPEKAHRIVLTGNDVLAADAKVNVISLPHDVIVTPLARDLAAKRGIRLVIMAKTERMQ